MKIIEFPFKIEKPMLACGADMKGAFALAKGNKAYLIEGFGSLSDPDNLETYEASIYACEKRLGIRPGVIACDRHPEYFSGRFAAMHALKLKTKDLRHIQHHEAHIASAIVEHSIKTDVIGVAFDGTGYGWDGLIWGGEFFVGGLKGFRRAAHLEYVPMPGGEAAIKEPWRMAASYLYKVFGRNFLKQSLDIIDRPGEKRLSIIRKMIDNNINSPLTSSAGRLFDAAGSLILHKGTASFEAELPIDLEKMASHINDDRYKFDIKSEDGMYLIETSGLFKGIVSDLRKNRNKSVMSTKFHNTAAEMIAGAACLLRKKSGLRKIVLSGGVFQNRYLTKRAALLLGKDKFDVYINSGINTNDYGIPIGQLAIANARGSCA
jgi:hydrogenase maturation protein HypF